ncbi:MAG TPA: serine/threonine-protein kinase [Polyangiaceae bacterium]|nr:serine/threonine-protein kinase [Polyangiaceae bacterium]
MPAATMKPERAETHGDPTGMGAREGLTSSRYRVLAELGVGGMAEVYVAVQLGQAGFRRLVVLKRLRQHLVQEPDLLQMFLQEARLAARLSHPNVINTHEVGHDGEGHFMAMDYLPGHTYHALLLRAGRESLDFRVSLKILIEALKGLEYAHELKDFDGTPMGVVHRDVSPGNLLVTYDGQVKVLDFGIAKIVNSSVETQTGVIKGKVSYMSPEQASCTPVGRETDLFAIGVLLWEAAAGRRRWQGLPDIAVLKMLLGREQFSPPCAAQRGLPPEVDTICMRAMAYEPADRYRSAREFRLDLERLAETVGNPVSQEQLGALVAELFADDRRQFQGKIEQQLKRLQKEEDLTVSGLLNPGSGSRSDVFHVGRATLGETTREETQPGPPERSPVRTRRTMAMIAILSAMAAGAATMALSTREPSPQGKLAASEAAPPPSSAVKQTEITLSTSVTPAHAKVYLDGKQLETNPAILKLPRGVATSTVRAEADGFVEKTITFTHEDDRVIQWALAPTETKEEPAARAATSRPQRGLRSGQRAPSADAEPGRAAVAPVVASSAPLPDKSAISPSRKRPKASVSLDTENPWQ